MAPIAEIYAQFVRFSAEIAYLAGVSEMLSWDLETMMPPAGSAGRSKAMAVLQTVLHEKSVAPEYGDCLTELKGARDAGRLDPLQSDNVERAWQAFQRDRLMPSALVAELAEVTGAALETWLRAREAKSFAVFQPTLERIVALTRQEGRLLQGSYASPYDAILQRFEHGSTVESLTIALAPLREFLPGFIRRLAASPHAPDPKLVLVAAPRAIQQRACRLVVETLGFDFNAGRLDENVHPFMSTLHPGDRRITTHYVESDALQAIDSAVHESGHGMYEQGLPAGHFGTAAGSPSTIAVHEAQSRLWENLVGRSRGFWRHFLPRLRGLGLMFDADVERFYRSLNTARPSFIRMDADEVTYNLHVLLRFEIERDLIEGRLEVADLRDAWNAKTREYLGLEVPDDLLGVLQDGHWTDGSFGYFPSYGLGNIFAAQLFAAAERDVPDLEERFADGDFRPLRDWLREKVWRHGDRYDPPELIRLATGELPSAAAFIRYIERKYGEIYRL